MSIDEFDIYNKVSGINTVGLTREKDDIENSEFGVIDRFNEQYDYLSNFYNCSVEYDGRLYSNAESAYQSAKIEDTNERDIFANISASKAKKMGRMVMLRADWEYIKDSVM